MKISADFLKKFIIIVLAALGLEVLVFNFRALQSLFYREVSYPLEECEMEYFDEYDDHVFKLKADNGVMYLTGLEEKMDGRTLHNVHLDISLPDAIDMPMVETGILTIEPYMRDAGHDAYARLAEHKVRDDIPVSKYLWVSGAGAIKTLTFGLSFTNGKLIQIHKITLNAHQPVCFSVWRFLLLIVLCSMVYGMRKESVLWKEEGGATVWQRWLPAALGCLLILPAAYLIFQNDYLTSSVNFQPYHELAERMLSGYGGGILNFRAGSKERAFKIINSLKYAKIASNIGDIRTLVIHPASTLYIRSGKTEMEAAGVFDDTVRVSVGIEDKNDLIEDFVNAVRVSR